MNRFFGLIGALLMSGITGFGQTSVMRVKKAFPIPGDGKWDYLTVNPANNSLYVAHGTEVNVVDKTSGKIIGVIANTQEVHGIAFLPGLAKGYTSNGKTNNVSFFDVKTNKIIGTVSVGANPDAIMYEPYSKMIVVCNGKSNDLTIIDPVSDKVVKTISLGGKPETAVSDGQGKLFVNIEDKSEVAVIDTKKFTVTNRWQLGKGEEPSGLAIDTKTKRLFSGCSNKLLIVMDANTGKLIKEMPIGEGSDGIAFDPLLHQIYSSNGAGTLTIIKERSGNDYVVTANVPTQKGARTIAVDAATHLVYLPVAAFEKDEKATKGRIVPGSFEVMVIGDGI